MAAGAGRPRRRIALRTASRRKLAVRGHTVFEIGPDLLLVFKPQGHAEPEHAHPYDQVLRILRGRLQVETSRCARRLVPASRPLRLPAGSVHATQALADTWLVAERRPSGPGGRKL